MGNFDPLFMVLIVVVIVPAIALHEFAHAKFADLAGDPTPRSMGRVTVNPLVHFDPIGFLMVLITATTGFGIGWGRPVIVDPRRMRNPKWDHFISVLAGPMCNLLQAVVYGVAFRLALAFQAPEVFLQWFGLGVAINLSLCFFNLIPFGPLDGHWLVGAFMPDKIRVAWNRFSVTTGALILFIVIIAGQFAHVSIIGSLIQPPVRAVAHLLGVDLA
jgi:Zn-dependent protease